MWGIGEIHLVSRDIPSRNIHGELEEYIKEVEIFQAETYMGDWKNTLSKKRFRAERYVGS